MMVQNPFYPPPPPGTWYPIFYEHILHQLRNIYPSKPPGPDDISPHILRNIIPSIIKPLTKLFNSSLSNKQLPYVWKISNITPVYKNKDNPKEPGNYRPIALTSILCKIMEKIMFK